MFNINIISHCTNHKNTVATKQYMYLVWNKLLLLLLLLGIFLTNIYAGYDGFQCNMDPYEEYVKQTMT